MKHHTDMHAVWSPSAGLTQLPPFTIDCEQIGLLFVLESSLQDQVEEEK